MSEEKQIEEMANSVCRLENKPKDCASCMWKATCNEYLSAESYYNAGYRKQSEGKWIPKPHISRSPRGRYISYNTYSCDVCGKPNGRQKTPFCPHCGAKMKGGDKE